MIKITVFKRNVNVKIGINGKRMNKVILKNINLDKDIFLRFKDCVEGFDIGLKYVLLYNIFYSFGLLYLENNIKWKWELTESIPLKFKYIMPKDNLYEISNVYEQSCKISIYFLPQYIKGLSKSITWHGNKRAEGPWIHTDTFMGSKS